MQPSKDHHSSAKCYKCANPAEGIRVEDPLHFSEDLKHLALDQILFAKENCPSFLFLVTSLVLSQISSLLTLIP